MHRNYINGQWLDGDSASDNINPSDTRDIIGNYARANAAQVEQAIAAAHSAAPRWANIPMQQRTDALDFVGTEILARRWMKTNWLRT